MKNIEAKLSLLKKKLESVAFLVSKGGMEREAHAKIVQSLVIVSELDATFSREPVKEASAEVDIQEINKISRRLKLWAKRQHQENSKILNAYLQLKRSGATKITENDLKAAIPENSQFESNFSQMKIIAEKNHGKIFDQYGEYIEIWKPVVSHIDEYEEVVFGGYKINDAQLIRNLQSVGQACFVKYFNIFSSKPRVEAIEILKLQTQYTEKSCISRTGHAQSIITSGLSKKALHIVISSDSPKVLAETKERASMLLQQL